MSECSIKVCVRFRPFNKREEKLGKCDKMYKITEDVRLDVVGTSYMNHTFFYDRVFDMDSRQDEVYEYSSRGCIVDVLSGYNGTIFAYGQTGAGKTFSMMGVLDAEPELKGIIPRATNHIFSHIENDTSGTEYSIKCSYLEIYQEQVSCLLDPTQSKKGLRVHESPSRGIFVQDLTEEYVYNEDEIYTLLDIGARNRAVAATDMNAQSSRSHTLFIMQLHQKTMDGTTKTGKLNLVDLAGSEKVGKTGAKGQTLDEAKAINASLSALGMCINALVEGKSHIPYRDSKLTRILQESLGGNTKTTLICACSPHEDNLAETISTLKFGSRAKKIKNNVKMNAQKSAAELQRLVDKLKAELTSLRKYCKGLEMQVEWMSSDEYIKGMEVPKEIQLLIEGGSSAEPSETTAGEGEQPSSPSKSSAPKKDGDLPRPSPSPDAIAGSEEMHAVEEDVDNPDEVNNPSLRTDYSSVKTISDIELELENQKRTAEAEIANLTSDIKELKEKDEEKEKELLEMKKEILRREEELKKAKEDVEIEKEGWDADRKRILGERERLEDEVNVILEEMEGIQDEKALLQSQYRQLQKEFDDYKTQNTDMDSLQAEQEVIFEELAASEEKIAELEESLSLATERAQESDSKRIHAEHELKETKSRFESLEAAARGAEEEAVRESSRRHELEGKLKLSEGKLQDLTSSLQAERAKVEELKKKLETTVEEKEAVIIELENDANKILAELQDAAEKEEELLVRMEELESKLADRNQQLKTLKTQVAKATGGDAEALTSDHFEDLEKLEKEHQRREASLESMVTTARRERDDLRNRLENDIISMRGEKERLERQVASQSESIGELEVKCRSLASEVDLWKEKSHNLEAAVKASENELKKLKDRLDQEVEKDAMNTQRVTLLLAEIEHMQNEHDELEKRHQAAMAKKEAAASVETKVPVENETTRKKLEAAQKEVASLTDRAEKTELEFQKSQRKLQAVSTKCESQEKRITAMEEELSESVKTTGRIKRDLAKKRKECEDLKLKLEEMNQLVESMHLVQESVARRPRMWRPVTKSSVLESFAQKEDFGQHLLRQTGSRFLKEAMEEDRRGK
eukprot:TRINITY_DN1462_c0_g1_i1.p1 TRINITY_DN1462_c0_g1~~TRINITY_DN1462_c0_g1_i1.p1  ORF type:complete len:1090 (-),score=371.85 TRINITY_DN1462_c0_g1_i1:233-3502(-)